MCRGLFSVREYNAPKIKPHRFSFTTDEGGVSNISKIPSLPSSVLTIRNRKRLLIGHILNYKRFYPQVKIDAFYDEMRKRGYSYEDEFCMVSELNEERKKCVINWTEGNKVTLSKSILITVIFILWHQYHISTLLLSHVSSDYLD